MNIVREWRRSRPAFNWRKRFTLDQLVDDFQRRRADTSSPLYKNRDDIVDYCAEADFLKQAIQRAVLSRRPDGRIHNHQSRVSMEARIQLGKRLIRDIRWLRKAKTFEQVLEMIERYQVPGIGPVTAYDVCTRVCAYLELEPSRLHLHAGCLQGLQALGRSRAVDAEQALAYGLARVGGVLAPDELPEALEGRLHLDEIEDFLCVYREVLDRCRS